MAAARHVAHLWFESIHPFEDGNGRIGRVLVDVLLAREAGPASRLVRLSQRLQQTRDAYYDQLEKAQKGTLDITAGVLWFLTQMRMAWQAAAETVDAVLEKSRFWHRHAQQALSTRQRKAVNLLLDAGPMGFEGGLSTRTYASVTGASKPTASRDLADLAEKGVLSQTGAGRSTRYYINAVGWIPLSDDA